MAQESGSVGSEAGNTPSVGQPETIAFAAGTVLDHIGINNTDPECPIDGDGFVSRRMTGRTGDIETYD